LFPGDSFLWSNIFAGSRRSLIYSRYKFGHRPDIESNCLSKGNRFCTLKSGQCTGMSCWDSFVAICIGFGRKTVMSSANMIDSKVGNCLIRLDLLYM
jgi:hypothetical protein